jgi:hypothetical protein
MVMGVCTIVVAGSVCSWFDADLVALIIIVLFLAIIAVNAVKIAYHLP